MYRRVRIKWSSRLDNRGRKTEGELFANLLKFRGSSVLRGSCSYPIYQPNLCRSWNSFSLVFLSRTTSREPSFISLSLSAKRRFLDKDKNLERDFFLPCICISWWVICIKAFAAFLFTLRRSSSKLLASVGHRFTCHCLLKGMERCDRLRYISLKRIVATQYRIFRLFQNLSLFGFGLSDPI